MQKQAQNKETKPRTLSRRQMLAGSAAAVAGLTIVPRHVLGGHAQVPPSEILNVACVGVGGRGMQNLRTIARNKDVRVVAICDVKKETDYSRFYYGGNGGWGPAMEFVDAYYEQTLPRRRRAKSPRPPTTPASPRRWATRDTPATASAGLASTSGTA
jgi:hypothetical protein